MRGNVGSPLKDGEQSKEGCQWADDQWDFPYKERADRAWV